MHWFHSFCLPSLQDQAVNCKRCGRGRVEQLVIWLWQIAASGQGASQEADGGERGAGEGAGFIFQSKANACERELPVVLLAHSPLAPLAAPPHGHSHKEKGPKRTGRGAVPYGSLLPQSSAINKGFTFQLPHWVGINGNNGGEGYKHQGKKCKK